MNSIHIYISKYKIILLFLAWIICPVVTISAQNFGQADTLKRIPFITVNYGSNWTGGDLAKDYGWNSELGTGFYMKLKNNMVFGVEGNFIVGDRVHRADRIFSNIENSSGYVIGSDGATTNYRIYFRGYKLPVFKIGKMISSRMFKASANSGFICMLGGGFMQYKTKIQDIGKNFSQIEGDYIKGYDRLTNGLCITGDIGYLYFGKWNLSNFYIGLNFTQGFTQNRRSYDFLTKTSLSNSRIDYLYGVRISWAIPLYKKMATGYYYN